MLKCKICGFKCASTTMMHNHVSTTHRSNVIRNHSSDNLEVILNAANLNSYFDGNSESEGLLTGQAVETPFVGGGGSLGGGGSAGSWDDSSSSSSSSESSSSDSGSSCDSGCSGD